MAGSGDGLSMNLAGMSKNQLYDIMSQMKTLIEQNQDQARQILIQNPLLTKALFQAQIMLGMLQPPQEIPKIQPAGSQHSQQATSPAHQPSAQQASLPSQNSSRDQTSAPTPSASMSPINPPLPSHPLQPMQHNRGHVNAQSASMPSPQSSNMSALPPHYSSQPPSVVQPTMSAASTPLQQPLHMSSMPQMPLQPPLPSQPRPPSMPPYPHQNYSHMGPNAGYQHPGAPQLHHSQPMFHPGARPPSSMGPPFSQGQPLPPNQQLSQASYQGGNSHVGMDFNQMGMPSQPDRGSNWMPGLSENAAGTQLPGPSPPFLPAHMGSGSQPPRPSSSLSADQEKALLQQVMSLTPEHINQLPPDQRNQVLQLQQMLRQ
ncbi:hydroxyproline-rich glycoprotein family protein [Artemisia annua]|uniref:Hydroxyproline-rich glycoprotein family protein n=1 Tax=Artemisia annua TaxID=35608 RepID=A0A2U1NQB4_ARTAN|nr:hydroxyproline-rich glycoprotein family protein [Artemisia annua]